VGWKGEAGGVEGREAGIGRATAPTGRDYSYTQIIVVVLTLALRNPETIQQKTLKKSKASQKKTTF
jgi:hypothetical protein